MKKLKFLRYAQIATYAYPFLFVLTMFMIAQNNNISYLDLVKENPIVTVGFINSFINILIYYQLSKIIKEYQSNPSKQGYDRSKLIFFIVILGLTLNLATVILLVMSLSKYYPNVTIKQAYQQVQNKNQESNFWKSNLLILGSMVLNIILLLFLI